MKSENINFNCMYVFVYSIFKLRSEIVTKIDKKEQIMRKLELKYMRKSRGKGKVISWKGIFCDNM